MKSIPRFIAIVLLISIGCRGKQNGSMGALANKEPKYKEGVFRRFTYFLLSDDPEVAESLREVDWGKVTKSAKKHGIYEASCYKKDNGYFFILDAKPTLDSKTMMESFVQLTPIKRLIEKFTEKGIKFPVYDNALERMYKLDQKVVYSPTVGQLKTDVGPHKRFVWTLFLQKDPALMAEYRKAHSIGHAWPQITKNMKSIGVKDMEIYLQGAQAILIMDTKPDFDMSVIGPKWQELPKEREWQEYVAKFQRTKPGSSIKSKWQDLDKL